MPPVVLRRLRQAIGIDAEPRGAGMNKTHAAAHVIDYLGQKKFLAAAMTHDKERKALLQQRPAIEPAGVYPY